MSRLPALALRNVGRNARRSAITAPATPTSNTAPTVTWDAAAGASKYDLKVASASGCADKIIAFGIVPCWLSI